MSQLFYPTLNGIRFDFTSIQFRVNGQVFPGIKSLNYKHSLEPGLVRGTAAQVIGRTRGQYNVEGDLEIYREDADNFLQLIAPASATISGQTGTGFMEVSFDMSVTFQEAIQGSGPATQNDVLKGCRIKQEESSNSDGGGPSTLKYSLHVMYLTRNGRAALAASQSLPNQVRF